MHNLHNLHPNGQHSKCTYLRIQILNKIHFLGAISHREKTWKSFFLQIFAINLMLNGHWTNKNAKEMSTCHQRLKESESLHHKLQK